MRKSGLEKDEKQVEFIDEKESELKICLAILQKLKEQYQPKDETPEQPLIEQTQELPAISQQPYQQTTEKPAKPVTQVFDNFNLLDKDKENDKEFLKKLLNKRQAETSQPPISFIHELKAKMEQRKLEVAENDPVQFQEFNKSHGQFVPLSKEDRLTKEQKHAQELQAL